MDKQYETAIGKLLSDMLPVEWMRFTMFYVDDIYNGIPMLVFRLKSEDGNMESLQKSIDAFSGNEKWCVFMNPFSRKGNYILSIEPIKEMYLEGYDKGAPYNEKDYFGEDEYKALCERAVWDIPMLLDHIGKIKQI
ncbi:hypothetical protein [Butyrivibrio sp. X503]|uniref:hypothetical protein n=1 Tax=Butyrivibrio sp. X503 TaxID=2364878 RepID=UPI001A9B361B|nr:hypothetical protein [Butyrivibrio sp. X503]